MVFVKVFVSFSPLPIGFFRSPVFLSHSQFFRAPSHPGDLRKPKQNKPGFCELLAMFRPFPFFFFFFNRPSMICSKILRKILMSTAKWVKTANKASMNIKESMQCKKEGICSGCFFLNVFFGSGDGGFSKLVIVPPSSLPNSF